MDHVNGHDHTPTAEAVQRLAAERKQQADQLAYQQRAMPLMLQVVTDQRNQAHSQLALAQAELSLLRQEYDGLLKQNEETKAELAGVREDVTGLRAELQAIVTDVGAAAGDPPAGSTTGN